MSNGSDNLPDTFGSRVAQARREYGVRVRRDVSPSDLAAMMGVSPATVYRWEGDEKKPRSETVARLAAVLGVMPGWLDYGQLPKERRDEHSQDELVDPTRDRKLTDEEIARARLAAAETRAKAQGRRQGTRRRRSGEK